MNMLYGGGLVLGGACAGAVLEVFHYRDTRQHLSYWNTTFYALAGMTILTLGEVSRSNASILSLGPLGVALGQVAARVVIDRIYQNRNIQ